MHPKPYLPVLKRDSHTYTQGMREESRQQRPRHAVQSGHASAALQPDWREFLTTAPSQEQHDVKIAGGFE
jgi:hypothetical protein